MAQSEAVIQCAGAMLVLWTLIGWPISARIAPRSLFLCLAPAIGWSVHSITALVLFSMLGMTRSAVVGTTLILAAVSLVGLWRMWPLGKPTGLSGLLILALLGAALLSLIPMAGILPKETADGVVVAPPIFDHSKIALVDEMVRSGVPPTNPFFGELGLPERVSYYYLWHFSAAVMAVTVGVSGWEADAALTWFTAFASLLTMIGFATWIGGQPLAGVLVVPLAATGSLRPILDWLLGESTAHSLIRWPTGFGGWLFQVSWAPQHAASAMLVVIACYLLAQLSVRRDPFLTVVLGLVAAAALASSTWVGGVTFAIAAAVIGVALLWIMPPQHRLSFVGQAAVAATLAIALVAVLLHDQFVMAQLRGTGSPVGLAPVKVLGDAFPETVRKSVDPIAYWLVYLPVELPAIFPAGLAALYLLLRNTPRGSETGRSLRVLALLVAASLTVAWLLASVVADNNDLGWRAVLPAIMLLIALAADGLARWLATPARVWPAAGAVALLLSLLGSLPQMRENLFAQPNATARAFANTPAMWESVRRHSATADRIGNNPHFLSGATTWPGNISWALLADRRSCYAGRELAIPFAPLSPARRADVDARFLRVFDGRPEPEDLAQLADRYRCDVIVVTSEDGAWSRDPFAASSLYRLVEERPQAWRIYRRAER